MQPATPSIPPLYISTLPPGRGLSFPAFARGGPPGLVPPFGRGLPPFARGGTIPPGPVPLSAPQFVGRGLAYHDWISRVAPITMATLQPTQIPLPDRLPGGRGLVMYPCVIVPTRVPPNPLGPNNVPPPDWITPPEKPKPKVCPLEMMNSNMK